MGFYSVLIPQELRNYHEFPITLEHEDFLYILVFIMQESCTEINNNNQNCLSIGRFPLFARSCFYQNLGQMKLLASIFLLLSLAKGFSKILPIENLVDSSKSTILLVRNLNEKTMENKNNEFSLLTKMIMVHNHSQYWVVCTVSYRSMYNTYV